MNVPRRIIYSIIIGAILTAAAIYLYPSLELVTYVSPVILLGFLATVVLSAASFHAEDDLTLKDKNRLMNGFLLAVLVPTIYTAGAFVHEGQTSWSGGEIHWHADYEVLVEENGELERLNLIDPTNFCDETSHESSYMCGVNDRVGSTEYHEHNDNRIHLEGSFKRREDATLSAFFGQFGGELTNSRIKYPTNEETVEKVEDADRTVKILVNKGVGSRYWCAVDNTVQGEDRCSSHGQVASNPSDYVISPYSRGANLDKIFIVYDSLSVEEALQDVREDGRYRGFDLLKSGEGYGG